MTVRLRRPCTPLLLVFACAASLPFVASAADAEARRLGSLSFAPCTLSQPGLPIAVEAQCTTLSVPEDRANPDGRQIRLGIGWVPASSDAEDDPVVLIAGGPGQAAKQAYPLVHAAFRDLRRTRHVLLLDARGTGDSQPLVCRNSEGEAAISEDDAGEAFSAEAARDFAERCARELGATANLRHYGTREHVEDLDALREAVGAGKLNLIGVSYGTRVAQQYAARYPQHTRTVTLDSVVPNTLVLGNEHARNLQDALNKQFARCREDAGCAEKIGDPSALLDRVGQQLRGGGQPPVRFRDARSGEWKEEVPRFGHLALLLRMYAYSPETATLLPWLLHEAAEGRYEALLAQAESLSSSLTGQIYHGMQLSVMCTEDADELRADPADEASVLGTEMVRFSQAQCAVWPRGNRAADFRTPLAGELPVLLLSGELDPVTPPRYADEVVKTLPKGRHLVLPGQGHSVVGLGCMPKLFAQFVETADASKLDASCLDRLKPLPPFAGPYGWEP